MHDHSLRDQIVAEVHARPFHKLSGPLALCHQAILYEGVAEETVNRSVRQLASLKGLPLPQNSEGFFFTRNDRWRCALNRMANFTV